MTIGEVATRAGLQASAIRYYEKLGLLAAPIRTGGRRIYQSEVVHQLLIISFAKEIGFTLEEIRLLLHDFPQDTAASLRWGKFATTKIVEIENIITKATAVKKMLESIMQCQCMKLEECAKGLAATMGMPTQPLSSAPSLKPGPRRPKEKDQPRVRDGRRLAV